MRETRNTQKKRNTRSIVIVGLLLLLVAVIGFGGYTLSKYVTKKSGNGSATVAKWGFTVEADASNIFGKQYKKGTIVEAGTEGIDVSASTGNDNNLVAPGTNGSMTFSVKGTAEVRAQIKINLDVTNDVVLKYTKDGVAQDDYTPVKWTLKNGENVLVNAGSLADVATALNKTNTYEPNAEAINEEYELSWAWAFSVDDEKDALDTLLGMYVADANKAKTEGTVLGANTYKAVDGTITTVAFTLDISITQLQQA